jgi:hypothetical protein
VRAEGLQAKADAWLAAIVLSKKSGGNEHQVIYKTSL